MNQCQRVVNPILAALAKATARIQPAEVVKENFITFNKKGEWKSKQ